MARKANSQLLGGDRAGNSPRLSRILDQFPWIPRDFSPGTNSLAYSTVGTNSSGHSSWVQFPRAPFRPPTWPRTSSPGPPSGPGPCASAVPPQNKHFQMPFPPLDTFGQFRSDRSLFALISFFPTGTIVSDAHPAADGTWHPVGSGAEPGWGPGSGPTVAGDGRLKGKGKNLIRWGILN